MSEKKEYFAGKYKVVKQEKGYDIYQGDIPIGFVQSDGDSILFDIYCDGREDRWVYFGVLSLDLMVKDGSIDYYINYYRNASQRVSR